MPGRLVIAVFALLLLAGCASHSELDSSLAAVRATTTTLAPPPSTLPTPTPTPFPTVQKVDVPKVKGLSKSDATSDLKDAGLTVKVVYVVTSGTKAGHVISQSVKAGHSVEEGTKVTIKVAKAPPPATKSPPPATKSPPPSNCTSGYSPCLSPASDYDCYGGSGNGPAYTEPGVVYRVTGSDPYGLDADNDGYGCE